MDEKEKLKFKLRKLLKDLSSHRARHTELVSVYVPMGYNIQNIINQISTELGTARNIKSATTRKNVQAALEKMLSQLRMYKKTPPNGVAIFSGNVSGKEGSMDVKVWAIEPPELLKMRLYKCDQVFFLDPLKELMLPKHTYGLLIVDRREANFALLKGKTIAPIVSMKSAVPGKFKAGGQSAARFSRVIENLAKDWFKKVGETANKEFDQKEIEGIIVGGPGPTKEDFANGEFMNNNIKKKIIGIKHLSYTGDFGLNELVEKSEDVLAKEDIIKEKKLVERFLTMLSVNAEKVAYGQGEVERAVEMGAVEVLLLSEDISDSKTEELIEKMDKAGGDILIISTETREGRQLSDMGGFAAILRFALQ